MFLFSLLLLFLFPYVVKGGPTCSINLPLLSYTFSQADCFAASFQETVTSRFPLRRSSTTTTCPVRNGFEYAATGIRSNGTDDLYPTYTENTVANTSLSVLSRPDSALAYAALSIEMWFGQLENTTAYLTRWMTFRVENPTIPTDLEIRLYAQSQFRIMYRTPSSTNITSVDFDRDAFTSVTGTFVNATDILYNATYMPLYATIVLEPNPTGNITIYLASISTGVVIKQTQAMQTPVPTRFVLNSTAKLHLLSKIESLSDRGGPKAELRYFAMYDYAMTQAQVLARMAVSFPNSVPSVKAAGFSFPQNSTYVVDLSTNVSTFDMDNDPITTWTLHSLPAKGDLYADGIRLTTAGVCVSATSELTYLQDNPYAYTVPNNLTACVWNTSYTSFNFSASDGYGESIQTATIYLCPINTLDAPVVFNATLTSVFVGDTKSFGLTPIDPNTYPLTTKFSSALQLSFVGTTTGTYGKLRLSSNGTVCNGTYLTAGTNYTFFVNYTGPNQDQFRFCYETSISNATRFGTDTFSYRVMYEDQVSALAYVIAPVQSPLEPCPTTPIYTISTLDNAVTVCGAKGEENSQIPIYLQGRDHFFDAGAVAESTQLYYISRLPDHGTLRIAYGPIAGPAVNTTTPISLPFSTFYPPLYYEPDTRYFTQTEAGAFSNYKGLGWDGCILETTQCRCALTVTPGCPDSFAYYFTVVRLQEYEDTIQTSPESNFTIQVTNIVSHIPDPDIPAGFNITFPADALPKDTIYTYLSDPAVVLVDPDDDAFMIGVRIETKGGSMLFMNLTAEEVLLPKWTFDCRVRFGCPGKLIFVTHPSLATELFARFYSTAVSTTFFSVEDSITIKLYKPSPIGMTVDIINDIVSDSMTPSNMLVIPLSGQVREVDSSSGGLDAATLASYLALSIVFGIGICVEFCLFVCLEKTSVMCAGVRAVCEFFRCRPLTNCLSRWNPLNRYECWRNWCGTPDVITEFTNPYDASQKLLVRMKASGGIRPERYVRDEDVPPLRRRTYGGRYSVVPTEEEYV